MTTFKHLGALAAGLLLASPALAADHGEAPGAAADPVADIADFYAWNTGESMVFIVTFAGLGSTTTAPMLDSDVLYGIHIDRDFDQVADANLWVRFGQNGAGDWGVQVTDVPGTSGAVSGAVGTVIESDGVKLWAGHADDPFFFDLAGFTDTLSTGDLAFTGADALAGLNVSAVAIEVDTTALVDGAARVDIWTTTGRK